MSKRKTPTDSRSELIGVRFTPLEKQELEQKSGNVPLSTYIRTVALRRVVRRPVPTINWEAYRSLQEISTSVREIERAVTVPQEPTESGEGTDDREWLTLLQQISQQLEHIGFDLIAANSNLDGEEEIEEEVA